MEYFICITAEKFLCQTYYVLSYLQECSLQCQHTFLCDGKEQFIESKQASKHETGFYIVQIPQQWTMFNIMAVCCHNALKNH